MDKGVRRQQRSSRVDVFVLIWSNAAAEVVQRGHFSACHGLYGSTSCCISHGPCQWERAIFDPPQLRDPWTDFHET